jgi:hypothetical protein
MQRKMKNMLTLRRKAAEEKLLTPAGQLSALAALRENVS